MLGTVPVPPNVATGKNTLYVSEFPAPIRRGVVKVTVAVPPAVAEKFDVVLTATTLLLASLTMKAFAVPVENVQDGVIVDVIGKLTIVIGPAASADTVTSIASTFPAVRTTEDG